MAEALWAQLIASWLLFQNATTSSFSRPSRYAIT